MSLQVLQDAIGSSKLRCPQCKKPIDKYEKFVEMADSVWDGAGDCDSRTQYAGSKVTLICSDDKCNWRERTEFWRNFIED